MRNFISCIALTTLLILAFSLGAQSQSKQMAGEKYRPMFHFTPPAHWMNDPNGMVYFEGEYHLFYQYYPDSTIWGPMHWGHAVSPDLVHWKHLPIALYPDSLGYIFSGSAVVDVNNTSGFGKPGKPAMIAIFTYHNMKGEKQGRNDYQTEGIAFSNDKGRTWTKYEHNPVLKNPGTRDFRDPKVSWNRMADKWIMTLAVGDHVCFYSSPNLKDWKLESEFGKGVGAHGGVWECPDLFELPVSNGGGEKKWVLLVSINPGGPNGGSATQYFVGKFDGHVFTNENAGNNWVDRGKDNYAGVTYSNIPDKDGRCISIGWMSNWQYAQVVPTITWRSAMAFPREIKLLKTGSTYTLSSEPVREIELLRQSKQELEAMLISGNSDLKPTLRSPLYPLEIKTEFQLPSKDPASDFGIELLNSKGESLRIGYNRVKWNFYVDRTNAGPADFSKDFKAIATCPAEIKGSEIDMHLLIDAASIELFAMHGEAVLTDIFFPTEDFSSIRFYSKEGSVQLKSGVVYRLNSIWQK